MRALLPLALLALLLAPQAQAASTAPYTATPSVTRTLGVCKTPVDGATACFAVTGSTVRIAVADATGKEVAYDIAYYSASATLLATASGQCGSPTLFALGATIAVTVRDGTGHCFGGGPPTAGTITASFV